MADTRGIKAGRAYVELGIGDKLTAGLKRAQSRLRAFGASVTAMGTKMLVLGLGLAAPLIMGVKNFMTMGDTLDKMSRRTGVAVEALSELGYAADLSGTSMEGLENGLRKMQRTITDAATGSKEAADALEMVGLSTKALVGLKPEDQFTVIAEALSRIEDPTRKAAIAMMIFGRSGTALLPMFENGAAGLKKMREEARQFNLPITAADAKAAAELKDAFTLLWKVIQRLAFAVGSALAPKLKDLVRRASTWLATAIKWADTNKGLIISFAKLTVGIIATGAALIVAGKAIMILAGLMGVAIAAVKALVLAFVLLTSPISLVIVAVGALGAYILSATGAGGKALAWLGERFAGLKDDATKAFQGISDALAAGDIGLAAKILWTTLEVWWTKGALTLTNIWIAFRNGFADIMASLGPILMNIGGKLVDTMLSLGVAAANALAGGLIHGQGIKAMRIHTFNAQQAIRDDVNVAIERINAGVSSGKLDPHEAYAGKQVMIAGARAQIAAMDAQLAKDIADLAGISVGDELKKIWSEPLPPLDTTKFEESLKGIGLTPEQLVQIAGLTQAVKDAVVARDALLKTAKEAREASEYRSDISAPDKPDLPDLPDLSRLMKATVVGSFSAAAAFGLGAGSAASRTAKATEETAKNTKTIIGRMQNGLPVFA